MRQHQDPSAQGVTDEIERAAADWVARIDLRGTPEEWSALDAWLNDSPRHRAAFLRLSVAWRRADELQKLAPLSGVLDSDLLDPARWNALPSDEEVLEGRILHMNATRAGSSPPPVGQAAHQAPTSKLRVVESDPGAALPDRDWAAARVYRSRDDGSRTLRAVAMSRAAAAIAMVAVVILGGLGAWWHASEQYTQVYSTRVGEFRRIALEDGSTIALNTNSEVQVRYRAGSRHVDLERGEALFRVAKNTARPFDVVAGSTTVRAVGTAFSVRLRDGDRDRRVDVVVSEGRIAINPPSARTYDADTVATVKNDQVTVSTVSQEDILTRLSWTTGQLAFAGESLAEAVAEFNRYNRQKLVIGDERIAGLQMGGRFPATDPEGFAEGLNALFGVRFHRASSVFGPDSILLYGGSPR